MTLLIVRMIEEQYHRDIEGRPIRESRTPPQFLRPGEIEHKTCPYPGQRLNHPKPMNVSALRQMGAHWDEVTESLAWLRARYDAAIGAHAPGFLDLWRVCQLSASLPWRYLFEGKEIQAYASSLAKATQGMGIWAILEFVRQIAERRQPETLTAERVLEFVVESKTLIGAHEVCSAGDKMLLKFFDVMVTPNPPPGRIDPVLDSDDTIRFAAHYTNFKLAMWIHFLVRRFVYADVAAKYGSSPELEALRTVDVEPPDFFLLEPKDLAAVPPANRLGWFRILADLVVPFAPDKSDVGLHDCAIEMANVLGRGPDPLTAYKELDALWGKVIAITEGGFRGSSESIDVPEDVRDRLMAGNVRKLFASLPNAPAS